MTAVNQGKWEFNVTVGVDKTNIELLKEDIEKQFATDYITCGLSYFIARNKTGLAELDKAEWKSIVNYNTTSGNLQINHMGSYLNTTNHSISIFLRAASLGNV